MNEENLKCLNCGHVFDFEDLIDVGTQGKGDIFGCPKCKSPEVVVEEMEG